MAQVSGFSTPLLILASIVSSASRPHHAHVKLNQFGRPRPRLVWCQHHAAMPEHEGLKLSNPLVGKIDHGSPNPRDLSPAPVVPFLLLLTHLVEPLKQLDNSRGQ